MKLFNAFRLWLKRIKEQAHEAKQKKREQYLAKTSWEDINVIEFNGRIYISYQDVPIVRVDNLKVEATELLAQAREDYVAWCNKFDK